MKRTPAQNKAMWLYFTMLADALNEAGHDLRKTLRKDIEIPWNKDLVHDFLWLPIQNVMLNIESTTEQESGDPQKVYDVLSRHLASKLGVNVPWPHNDPYDELGSKK